MSQSLMINNIIPKTDKEVGMVLSCHYHLAPRFSLVEDRAGHDRRYAIDATKLENELDWRADENFDSGIIKTIEWYLEKYSN